MSTGKTVVIAVAILVFFGMLMASLVYSDQQDNNQMKACVAAGKDWVRDFGNYYECKEVKE